MAHFARTYLLYVAEEVRAQVAQVLKSIHTELWLPAEVQLLDARQGNGETASVVADLSGGVVRFDPKSVKPTDIVLLTDCKVRAWTCSLLKIVGGGCGRSRCRMHSRDARALPPSTCTPTRKCRRWHEHRLPY